METKLYSQAKLINKTLKLLNKGRPEFAKIQKEQIEQILEAYEKVITDVLKEAAEPNTEVTAKIFNGLRVIATYTPEQKINLYGGEKLARARVATKAKVSKYFNYCVINERKGMGN